MGFTHFPLRPVLRLGLELGAVEILEIDLSLTPIRLYPVVLGCGWLWQMLC